MRDGTQGWISGTRLLAAAGSGCHSLKTCSTVYTHTVRTWTWLSVCCLGGCAPGAPKRTMSRCPATFEEPCFQQVPACTGACIRNIYVYNDTFPARSKQHHKQHYNVILPASSKCHKLIFVFSAMANLAGAREAECRPQECHRALPLSSKSQEYSACVSSSGSAQAGWHHIHALPHVSTSTHPHTLPCLSTHTRTHAGACVGIQEWPCLGRRPRAHNRPVLGRSLGAYSHTVPTACTTPGLDDKPKPQPANSSCSTRFEPQSAAALAQPINLLTAPPCQPPRTSQPRVKPLLTRRHRGASAQAADQQPPCSRPRNTPVTWVTV